MSDFVRLSKEGNIAVITVNNPPVNALTPGVPEGISEAIDAMGKDPSVAAAVLIGAGSNFIAGAVAKGASFFPAVMADGERPAG